MKKLLLITLLFFCMAAGFSQIGNIKDQVSASKDTAKGETFTKVEIESSFPGGQRAWIQFLQNNLVYPKKAVKKKIEGTVVVQFIVNKDGSISDISAISGPEELQQSAIDVLKKSPNWKPAQQGGRFVKSYKKQPINYRLEQ